MSKRFFVLYSLGCLLLGSLSFYIFTFLVTSIAQSNYNACIQDVVNTIESSGKVSIPVMTTDGQEGTIVLVPLTQTNETTDKK